MNIRITSQLQWLQLILEGYTHLRFGIKSNQCRRITFLNCLNLHYKSTHAATCYMVNSQHVQLIVQNFKMSIQVSYFQCFIHFKSKGRLD